MKLMKNVKILTKVLFLLMGVVLIAEVQGEEYDVTKRFKLNEDRIRTYEMLNPLGHDFVFDLTGLLNQDVFDVIDDGEAINDSGSDSDKLAAAREFLTKYDKTEQNVRATLKLGAPLPSFSLFNAKIKPSLRVDASIGVLMGIRSGTISIIDVINGLSASKEVKDALNSCDFSSITDGTDIVIYARDTLSCITPAQASAAGEGKYFFKDLSTTVPNLFSYAKADVRVGVSFDYVKGKHWFGNFSLYGHGRADAFAVVTEQSLAGNGEIGSFGDEANTTVNITSDYRFGYRNGRLRGWLAVEELKISEASNNNDAGGELVYGNDPLIRVHGEYIYRYSGFSVKPFVGMHKRSGYDFADGLYLGGDLGLHFWGNRLGVRARGMLDKEHFTISPQLKLWLMHVDYMLKVPVSSEVNGVKPATIHSLNLRFFI